tara:strand:+ start:2075 stop:2239 length:165 start_codon:yes stop_codon:yes gene_type:complete
VLDPDTSEVLDNRALGGMGWAALTPAVDNEHVIVGNFFSGDVRVDRKFNCVDRE